MYSAISSTRAPTLQKEKLWPSSIHTSIVNMPAPLPMQPMRRALVPTRVLEQIQLVIILRIVPLRRLQNLGDDLLAFGREVLRLDLLGHALGDLELLWGVCEDRGAVFYRIRVQTRSNWLSGGLGDRGDGGNGCLRVPVSAPWRLAVVGSCVR
jgi:hypothetical protein